MKIVLIGAFLLALGGCSIINVPGHGKLVELNFAEEMTLAKEAKVIRVTEALRVSTEERDAAVIKEAELKKAFIEMVEKK